MKKFVSVIGGMLIPALIVAGAFATSAMAQDKAAKAEKGKPVMTVLAENEKVKVWELSYKPGDTNASPPASATRVIRVLKGGEQLWTFEDGKTQKNVYKTGEVRVLGPGPKFTSKNVGKTDILLYVVMVK